MSRIGRLTVWLFVISDMFSVIMDRMLFPRTVIPPADYEGPGPWELDAEPRPDKMIFHVANFVEEYVRSDVLVSP